MYRYILESRGQGIPIRINQHSNFETWKDLKLFWRHAATSLGRANWSRPCGGVELAPSWRQARTAYPRWPQEGPPADDVPACQVKMHEHIFSGVD